MKILSKLALAALVLCSTAIARADTVSGYIRSNGTYVAPYYRTPANGTPYDNLSYRGYPSQQPGYVSPGKLDLNSSVTMPKNDFSRSRPESLGGSFSSGTQTVPNLDRVHKLRTY